MRLLQRTTRQLALTEVGKGFHERVVAILAGVEEAEGLGLLGRPPRRGASNASVSAPTSSSADMHVAPQI